MQDRSAASRPSDPGDPVRWRAWIATLRARWNAHVASRLERDALEKLGAALAAAGEADRAVGERVRAAAVDVAYRDAHLEALRMRAAASLQEDRTDYAEASSWMRPLVIFRGIATRSLVRDCIRRARKERAVACRALGGAALDEGISAVPVGTWFIAATEARARTAVAIATLDAHLAGLRGGPMSMIAGHAVREAVALGKPLVHEVRGRLFPRVPALAGLAVGWWIARTFTDSRFSATLHALGIGSGARHVVSTQQLRAMEFWLPVAAAAICSYASGRLAALVRSRYAPAPGQGCQHDGQREAPTTPIHTGSQLSK